MTKRELEIEIMHYKTLLSGRYGKCTTKQAKEIKTLIDRYQNYLNNFDKLDLNHDGDLDKNEVNYE